VAGGVVRDGAPCPPQFAPAHPPTTPPHPTPPRPAPQHGMSIGIGDTVADDATMAKVNSILEEAKGRVQDVIERFQTGQLEGQPGRTMMEAFEAK
jgi:hypothetical protein